MRASKSTSCSDRIENIMNIYNSSSPATLFAQRHLSAWIVGSGGDYIWHVKDNQSQLHHDIEALFAPDERVQASARANWTSHAEKWNKTHGRLECRTLSASSMLKGFANWPHAEQGVPRGALRERMRDGPVTWRCAMG